MRQGPEASECTGQVAIRRLCCGVVPRYMKPAVWRGSVLGFCLCCMDGLNLAGWEMGRVHAWTPNREDWKQEQGTRGGRQREQPSWVRLRQHGYRAVQYFVVHYRTDCTVQYCTPLTVGAMVSTYPIHIDGHCLLSIGHVTWTIHLVPLVPRTPMTLQTVPSRLREIPPTHRPRRESSHPPPLLDLELPGTISPPVRHSTRPPSSLRPTVRPGQPL